MSQDIMGQLCEVLESRKSASGDDSYVASLYEQGLDKILEKVGEEAVENMLRRFKENLLADLAYRASKKKLIDNYSFIKKGRRTLWDLAGKSYLLF